MMDNTPSTTSRATVLTGMAAIRLISSASNSRVKLLSGRVQGTVIFLTPHTAQRTRGARACR
jgi:hypothetical protein